ncbi:MAG TPA: hypothetical protein PLI98_15675, partial [Candidatus Hydrogenedentes bacterium]|nr:hypothetical protein [Candidatus Hydrogenedentota bacterium]
GQEPGALWRDSPAMRPTVHAFPVYSHEARTAFMIPVEIAAQQEGPWQVSDAFGRFSLRGRTEETYPLATVGLLLEQVEQAWEACKNRPLLLFARFPQRMTLGCPVHLDAIDGDSLQLPLLVALIRSTAGARGTLPFGPGPVFSSGTVDLSDGAFGEVGFLKEKIRGFLREYGRGHPALLTPIQMEQAAPFREEFSALHEAANLDELVALPEVSGALEAVSRRAPSSRELSSLAREMERLERTGAGPTLERILAWALPSLEGRPGLRFVYLYHAALSACHRGMYLSQKARFCELRRMIGQHRQAFGVNERVRLAAGWATEAFDHCDNNRDLEHLFCSLEKDGLGHASMAERARFWGARSQFLRLGGRHSEAAEAAKQAVRFAELADPAETGRDINYQIHALLRRAQADQHALPSLLKEAHRLLGQSRKAAPDDSFHQLFCVYYGGELARLRGVRWAPPGEVWQGTASHPRAFCLMSCARNGKNSSARRREAVGRAAEMMEALHGHPDDLFGLFEGVFRHYAAALAGDGAADGLRRQLKEWLGADEHAGWRARMRRALAGGSLLSDMDRAEMLCDAIPHL